MKEIIVNKHNLKEEDITEVVKRVKCLIINSNNEILLGYSHNTYQFPGGHVEDDEELKSAVIREVKEETGIEITSVNKPPFALLTGYYKDWPSKGKNRKIEIYYYLIETDEEVNLENTNYTKSEKEGNFEIRRVSLDKVEEELQNNIEKYGDSKGIEHDNLEIIKIYKSNK